MNLPIAAISLVIGIPICNVALAQERAVSETNIEFFSTYEWIDFASRDSDQQIVAGGAAIYTPLGERLGLTVDANIGRTKYDENRGSNFKARDYSARIFLRRPAIGALALGAGNYKTEHTFGNYDEDYFTALAAHYGRAHTLAIDVTEADRPNAANDQSGLVAASLYPRPNVLVSLTAGILDSQKTYSVFAEHQPGTSGLSYGVRLGRGEAYDDYSFAQITFAYRLAKPKTLFERYRHDVLTVH